VFGWAAHLNVLKGPVHDECIHIAMLWVAKGIRERPDRREAEPFPQSNCSSICTDDEVELHVEETRTTRFAKAVDTHGLADAATGMCRVDHERRVRDMRSEIALIWYELVHAEDLVRFDSHIRRHAGTKPVGKSIVLGCVGREDVAVTRRYDRFEDFPHGWEVFALCSANVESSGRFHGRTRKLMMMPAIKKTV